MRSAAKRKLGADPPVDDSLVLFCWLLVLMGTFGLVCWLCYRLLHLPPFVLVPSAPYGS